MGGAVSSGHDNDELIDHLIGGNYIRSPAVERVFRALDRGDYMTVEARQQAYKDLAWKNGLLHLSAPCIYSEVMEGLLLKPGLSFLNIGSGTGYLSTLAGLMLGSNGTNHGVEIYKSVIEYANRKLTDFVENSPIMDEFEFCEPKFFQANGLNLSPPQALYDRVYCGAACPVEYSNYLKSLIKVGGILVMPLNDNLVQVRRLAAQRWHVRSLLSVSFATLRLPSREEAKKHVKLEALGPRRLEQLARAAVRRGVLATVLDRRPDLRRGAEPRAPATKPCIRRIRIPIDEDSNLGLNALHDLDGESGANEMNALLSLVLSMGQHSGAGALRLEPPSASDGESDASGELAPRPLSSPTHLLLDRYEPSTDQSSDEADDGRGGNGNNGNGNNGNGNNGNGNNGNGNIGNGNIGNGNNGNGNNANNGNVAPALPVEDTSSTEESEESRESSTATPEPPSTSPKSGPSTSQYVSQSSSSRTEGGTSKTEDDVEWDGDTDEDADDDDDDEEEIHTRRQKRQKLDSGIGDEHPCGSSPDKTASDTSKMDASDTSDSRRRSASSASSSTDEEPTNTPLRRKKRPHSTGRSGPASRRSARLAPPSRRSARLAAPPRSSARPAPPPRRTARAGPAERRSARLEASGRRAEAPGAAEAGRSPSPDEGLQRTRQESMRRLDVSVNMRRAIHRLPLPPALKIYVNHNRGFQ